MASGSHTQRTKAPWKRPNPRKRAGKATKHLSAAKKAAAKARARKAGRPYPNLVDNMHMASKSNRAKSSSKTRKAAKETAKTAAKSGAQKSKAGSRKTAKARGGRQAASQVTAVAKRSTAARKSASNTSSGNKSSRKAKQARVSNPEKDPRGGLTAVGRKAFARREGAHLQKGVTKKMADMTSQDMRRKGSWAVRFYGRKTLPPLIDAKGKPTRHALSAHAWGEPVPRTVAAARRIAAKGKRLLARYRRSQRR